MKKLFKILLFVALSFVGLFVIIVGCIIIRSPSSEDIKVAKEKEENDKIWICDNFLTEHLKKENPEVNTYKWQYVISTAKECIKRDPVKYSSLNKDMKTWEKKDSKYQKENKVYTDYIDKHGDRPEVSSWDGSYSVVKEYLKLMANDPSSIEMAGCSAASWGNPMGWEVSCVFRGNNAFGGKVKSAKVFYISKQRVISL